MLTKLESKRVDSKITQDKLASRVGITIRTLQRYESGERVPDVHTAIRISRQLNKTVEELFPLPEETTKEPSANRLEKNTSK